MGGSSLKTQIVDLKATDNDLIEQISTFSVECFRKYAPGYVPTLTAAGKEVIKSLADDRRSRVMLDEGGQVLGWIGGIPHKNTWEIHPLAVKPAAQRKGYGKSLVEDLCAIARQNGAVSIWAGTGDETRATSFSHIDLYQDLDKAVSSYDAPDDHPLHFWTRIGFSITGVLPDEEGLGKPGIHLAKRIV